MGSSPRSLRFYLAILCLIGAMLVVQNTLMLLQLQRANASLAAIRESSRTMEEDVQHVMEDVESNADALENLQALLEESLEGRK